MTSRRSSYTLNEDNAIVQYIIKGNYETMVGGNKLWKLMEKSKTCQGRSWQSLKNRFMKNIRKDLSRPEFGLTHERRFCLMAGANEHGNSREQASSVVFNQDSSSSESINEVVQAGSNTPSPVQEACSMAYPYSLEEDKSILHYIIKAKSETMVGGNKIWKELEKSKTCPGRTWQSLKNRFLKNIKPDLSRPEFGLTHQQKLTLTRGMNHLASTSREQVCSQAINLDMSSDSSDDEQRPINNNNASGSGDHKVATNKKTFPKKEFLTWDAEWSDSDTE